MPVDWKRLYCIPNLHYLSYNVHTVCFVHCTHCTIPSTGELILYCKKTLYFLFYTVHTVCLHDCRVCKACRLGDIILHSKHILLIVHCNYSMLTVLQCPPTSRDHISFQRVITYCALCIQYASYFVTEPVDWRYYTAFQTFKYNYLSHTVHAICLHCCRAQRLGKLILHSKNILLIIHCTYCIVQSPSTGRDRIAFKTYITYRTLYICMFALLQSPSIGLCHIAFHIYYSSYTVHTVCILCCRARRLGEIILHSKHILLIVVVVNLLDCCLVLGELILDIHFIKGNSL